MKARNRTLIALAIGTVLAAPMAMAQSVEADAKVGAGVDLPNPVPAAQQSLEGATEEAKDATSKAQDRVTDAATATQDRVDQTAKEAMESPPPPADDNSKVAVDNVWRQFDADADGKLSAAEVEADANISGSFSAMDEDSDGFVTETEYRAYAKVNTKPDDPTN